MIVRGQRTAGGGQGLKSASATIRDVAQVAEVSVASVSRALNGHSSVHPDTRARVLAAVSSLDQILVALRAAAGDLDSRIEIDSPDEFGALARQFNAMTAAIKEHQAQLVAIKLEGRMIPDSARANVDLLSYRRKNVRRCGSKFMRWGTTCILPSGDF